MHTTMLIRGTVALTAIVALAASGGAAALPTTQQDALASSAIDVVLEQDTQRPDTEAQIVRLAFHDCAPGRCDGCINLANPGNGGLAGIIDRLEAAYDAATMGMSRADFWALAAVLAVRRAAQNQRGRQPPVPPLSVVYGRVDCGHFPDVAPADAGFAFPDARRGGEHVGQAMGTALGLSDEHVVALMGAHALGDAQPQNSGYRGPWAPPLNRLDNAFFVAMRAPRGWRQQAVQSAGGTRTRFQWQPQDGTNAMMLNTDVALYHRIAPEVAEGRESSGCADDLTGCPRETRFADHVDRFADDNAAFHAAFGAAFQLLISTGQRGSGELLPASDATTVEPTTTSPEPTTTTTTTTTVEQTTTAPTTTTVELTTTTTTTEATTEATTTTTEATTEATTTEPAPPADCGNVGQRCCEDRRGLFEQCSSGCVRTRDGRRGRRPRCDCVPC